MIFIVTFILHIFRFNRDNKVIRINYNTTALDTVLNLPLDQIGPLYRSLVKFDHLLHSERFCIQFKMNPGKFTRFYTVENQWIFIG